MSCSRSRAPCTDPPRCQPRRAAWLHALNGVVTMLTSRQTAAGRAPFTHSHPRLPDPHRNVSRPPLFLCLLPLALPLLHLALRRPGHLQELPPPSQDKLCFRPVQLPYWVPAPPPRCARWQAGAPLPPHEARHPMHPAHLCCSLLQGLQHPASLPRHPPLPIEIRLLHQPCRPRNLKNWEVEMSQRISCDPNPLFQHDCFLAPRGRCAQHHASNTSL